MVCADVSQVEETQSNSSKANRADKKIQLVAHLIGVGPSPTVDTVGVEVGYHLDQDLLLLVEATSGTSTYISGSRDVEKPIVSKSFGTHLKYYSGNSFYYRAGLDYRTVDYRETLKGNPFGTETISFNGESVIINFIIGNQWQWDNFTLGCDWVGLSYPIYSKVKDEYFSPATLIPSSYKHYTEEMDLAQERFVKGQGSTLLRFYLGYSF